jgi:hypothetical protein
MNRTFGILLLIASLVVPVAAAQDAAPDARDDTTTYYLNQSDGGLVLTLLPPSAANHSSWRMEMNSGYGGREVSLFFGLPGPVAAVNETAGFSGNVSIGYVCEEELLLTWCDSLDFDVYLWEGNRSVHALNTYLYGTYGGQPETYSFGGDFPGHGDKAAPHTHGNGSGADRPLLTSDLVFELRFTEASTILDVLDSGRHVIDIYVDGTGFAALQTFGALEAAQEATAAAPDDGSGAGNATDGNATGNGTANGTSSAGGDDWETVEHRSSAGEAPTMAVPSVPPVAVLVALAAAAGFALRRRLR